MKHILWLTDRLGNSFELSRAFFVKATSQGLTGRLRSIETLVTAHHRASYACEMLAALPDRAGCDLHISCSI